MLLRRRNPNQHALSPEAPRPHAARLHDGEPPAKTQVRPANGGEDVRDLRPSPPPGKPEEKNPRDSLALQEENSAKVLVVGDQDPPLPIGEPDDRLVIDPRVDPAHLEDIVTRPPELARPHLTFIDNAGGTYFRPESGILTLVGVPSQAWDLDPDGPMALPAEAPATGAQLLTHRIPAMERATLARGYRAVDGYSRDRHAILGRVEGVDAPEGIMRLIGARMTHVTPGCRIPEGINRRMNLASPAYTVWPAL